MLLYLHGFRSSPASAKSQSLRSLMAERGQLEQFWCGQLPVSPTLAMALLDAVIGTCDTPPTLVGSSLGGYYATFLAEKFDLKAVLINPVVLSALNPEHFLGDQFNYHTQEHFTFTREHVAELKALDVPAITKPERYWLLAETGDEVLDAQAALKHFEGARQTVLEGGDHSFSRFDDYREEILAFAGLV